MEYLYDQHGNAVGFTKGRYVFDMSGRAIGQLNGTHVHQLRGDYVGESNDQMVVDMHLGNLGNIGKPWQPGKRWLARESWQ